MRALRSAAFGPAPSRGRGLRRDTFAGAAARSVLRRAPRGRREARVSSSRAAAARERSSRAPRGRSISAAFSAAACGVIRALELAFLAELEAGRVRLAGAPPPRRELPSLSEDRPGLRGRPAARGGGGARGGHGGGEWRCQPCCRAARLRAARDLPVTVVSRKSFFAECAAARAGLPRGLQLRDGDPAIDRARRTRPGFHLLSDAVARAHDAPRRPSRTPPSSESSPP